MKNALRYVAPALIALCAPAYAFAQAPAKAAPIFVGGMAQIVPAFQDSSAWIRHDLWVETSLDSDRDGKKDRGIGE